MRYFKTQWMMALALGIAVSACSKKQKQEGDAAGDVAVETTDLPQDFAPGQKIADLGTVYFAFDSFEISGASRTTLDANANWLMANSSRRVQIEGHTDERGTTEYNLALGERRAGAVRDYLVSRGVSPVQLSTISYGEERPAVMGSDESAWSQNRRAEFVSGQ